MPRFRLLLIILTSLTASGPSLAAATLESCYAQLELDAPPLERPRALYVLIDQTMYTTEAMRSAVSALVADWGKSGDRIKILRFSANTRGQYTELMADVSKDVLPDEAYLYHLRDDTKAALLKCLDRHQQQYREIYATALDSALRMTDPKLPKTDLFYSLKTISTTALADGIPDKTVLLISDGLENSAYMSFHKGQSFAALDPAKVHGYLQGNNLIANWAGAEIYMYGLGFLQHESEYIKPAVLEPLKRFWHLYFSAGNGKVREIGTPALLLNSIRERQARN